MKFYYDSAIFRCWSLLNINRYILIKIKAKYKIVKVVSGQWVGWSVVGGSVVGGSVVGGFNKTRSGCPCDLYVCIYVCITSLNCVSFTLYVYISNLFSEICTNHYPWEVYFMLNNKYRPITFWKETHENHLVQKFGINLYTSFRWKLEQNNFIFEICTL